MRLCRGKRSSITKSNRLLQYHGLQATWICLSSGLITTAGLHSGTIQSAGTETGSRFRASDLRSRKATDCCSITGSGNLDLFVIGFDNHGWSTFWNNAAGWNRDWFPLPGQAIFDHEKQQIAAVSRAPGNLDLFVIGFDNHGWSTFWGPHLPNTSDNVVSLDSGPLVTGEPLGGSVKVVMNNKGDFTFNGHMHNSGFNNIGYVATAVVITPSAIAYSLQHSGHTEGTSAGCLLALPSAMMIGCCQEITLRFEITGSKLPREGFSRVSMPKISSLADCRKLSRAY